MGIQSVVTGGTAVDFYAAGAAGTSGNYPQQWAPSADVDIVALAVTGWNAQQRLKEGLADQLGFEPRFRSRDADGVETWSRTLRVPGFAYGFEIVGDSLIGDPRAERVFTVEVDGEPVTLRGPEDVILAYAESGWATWHGRDWERALAVSRAMRAELDLDYLRARALERGFPGVLEEVLAQRPLPDRRRGLF